MRVYALFNKYLISTKVKSGSSLIVLTDLTYLSIAKKEIKRKVINLWGLLVLLIFCKILEHQIMWSLCSVVFLAFTLKLTIQTLLCAVPTPHFSDAPHNFRKTSTSLVCSNMVNYSCTFFRLK